MRKIYYSDKTIAFGTRAEFDAIDCQHLDSIDQTKLEKFSDSAKPIAIICDEPELEFQKFITTFELIEAAGGVVRTPEGSTLMIFRNGRWDLPKGKREKGESMIQCALREVEEECAITNLTVETFRAETYHIYMLHGRYVLKRSSWWNMSHDGDCMLKPQIEEGITQVCWVAPSQMPECLANTYSTIRDILL